VIDNGQSSMIILINHCHNRHHHHASTTLSSSSLYHHHNYGRYIVRFDRQQSASIIVIDISIVPVVNISTSTGIFRRPLKLTTYRWWCP